MKRKHFSNILALFMIMLLVFYQGYPLMAVFAESSSSSSDSGTENASSSDAKDDNEDEEDEKKDDEEKDDDAKESDDSSEENDSKDETDTADDSREEDSSNDEKDDGEPSEGKDETPSSVTNETESDAFPDDQSDDTASPSVSSDENLSDDSVADPDSATPDETSALPGVEEGSISSEQNDNSQTYPSSQEIDPVGGDGASELAGSQNFDTENPANNDPAASADTSVTNENHTTTVNTVETAADTGSNVAEENATASNDSEASADEEALSENDGQNEMPDAPIDTSDASAETVIKNEVNTNITTDNGTVTNLDIYDYTGDIDLLKAFQTVLDGAKKITDSNTEAISLAIHNINEAVVENDASTSASTGDNSADSSGGSADISTGDASAITDIVNYINTNIVGSNWLYVTLNIFGNWNGDLIVPGDGLLNVPSPSLPSSLDISNYNSAEVENNVTTTASTGNNNADGGLGGVLIQTGTASSGTNVANILNTNIVESNWFLLLINNMGSWTGKLLNWGGEEGDVLSYDFSFSGDIFSSMGNLSVINENSAEVSNNVTTTASTGGNSASGQGDAKITTGNAFAWTNIFNMINTNIIGDNWFFAIVNNMGDWNGNVEFAYPDLAVVLTDNSSQVSPGEHVTYTIHYKNLGRADSAGTKLKLSLPSDLKADRTEWNLASLKSDQEGAIDVKVKVKGDTSSGEILAATAEISTETKEINLGNNSSTDQIGVWDPLKNEKLDSKIVVKRSTTAKGKANPGDYVKNTIIVENKSDNTLYNVALNEEMLMSDNTKLADFSWPIGEMKKGGKIMIEYDFIVNNPGQSLDVSYVARAAGQDLQGKDVKSQKSSSLLTVLGFAFAANAEMNPRPEQAVAGVETSFPDSAVLAYSNSVRPENNTPFWIWIAAIFIFFLIKNNFYVSKVMPYWRR